jgi:hypothetical protein
VTSEQGDRDVDKRVAEFLGNWAAYDSEGNLLPTYAPTSNEEQAAEFLRWAQEGGYQPVAGDTPRQTVLNVLRVLTRSDRDEDASAAVRNVTILVPSAEATAAAAAPTLSITSSEESATEPGEDARLGSVRLPFRLGGGTEVRDPSGQVDPSTEAAVTAEAPPASGNRAAEAVSPGDKVKADKQIKPASDLSRTHLRTIARAEPEAQVPLAQS